MLLVFEVSDGMLHEVACMAMQELFCDILRGTNGFSPMPNSEIISFLRITLSYKYEEAWPHLIRSIGQVFHSLSELDEESQKLVLDLVNLHISMTKIKRNEVLKEIEASLGCAIEACGVEGLLKAVPFWLQNSPSISVDREFLIPLIRDHGKKTRRKTSLGYFYDTILEKISLLETSRDERNVSGAATIDKCILQYWSLLPAFALNPLDFNDIFPKMVPIMLGILQNKRANGLQIEICHALLVSGLRKIQHVYSPQTILEYGNSVKETEEVSAIVSAAKSLLPPLVKTIEEEAATGIGPTTNRDLRQVTMTTTTNVRVSVELRRCY